MKTKQEQDALKYARKNVNEHISGTDRVAIIGNLIFFHPVFDDEFNESMVVSTGHEFFIVNDNGEYRLSSQEEFDRVTALY